MPIWSIDLSYENLFVIYPLLRRGYHGNTDIYFFQCNASKKDYQLCIIDEQTRSVKTYPIPNHDALALCNRLHDPAEKVFGNEKLFS